MAKSGKSLFDRIGSVKNSLENAEQSFKDNQDMRGELDLMLAEAELKNLRRKKDVPWTWNRHVLAICVACMVFFGGLVGWYFAVDQYQDVNAKGTPIINSVSKVQKSEQAKNVMPSKQTPIKDDKIDAAFAIGRGGFAEAICKMCFGSKVGANIIWKEKELFASLYGSFVFTSEDPDLTAVKIGELRNDSKLFINEAELDVNELYEINNEKLNFILRIVLKKSKIIM